jgi:Mce-associated membrane protein
MPDESTPDEPGTTTAETPVPDPDEPELAEPEAAPDPPMPTAAGLDLAASGRRAPWLLISVVALVVTLVAAAWAGWSLHSAAAAGPPPAAAARAQALADGEQAVQNFNTLDYRHVAQGVRLWLQSSAGALHAEVLSGQATFEKEVQASKTITTARVLDGAVTALSLRAGTARIIVAVQVTVTPAQGTAQVKQSRITAALTRAGGTWKLTSIGQVPIDGTRGASNG